MNKYIIVGSVVLTMLLRINLTLGQTINNGSDNDNREPLKFHCNPLVLNDNPLDINFFSIFSRGRLTVVAGNPASKEATKIPFRVYLRRSGMIIQKGASDSSRQLYDVDIATVLALAQPGDELIVDPVRRADWVARRILRVKGMNWLFPGC